MERDKSQNVLLIIAIVTCLVGVILAAMGVFLVYIGAKGDTEFIFFGQSFRSANVGIAAIFLGAALIVLNLRKILTSFDKTIPPQEGKKAPGKLRIDNILITQDKPPLTFEDIEPAKCLVDFWVTNDGGSQVTITGVDFKVIDTARCELVKGPMESSKTYDIDITALREPGAEIRCPFSQSIDPGKSDRFTISVVASGLGLGVFAVWKLVLTLITNYGDVKSDVLEIWLPFTDTGTTLRDLKNIQAMEKSHGIVR